MPQRGEKKDLVTHALANAREALGRKLADTSSQQKLLAALAGTLGLPQRAAPHRGLRQQPHPGLERGRRHDRRGAGGFPQKPVPQVQHPLGRAHARRRLRHDARDAGAPLQAADRRGAAGAAARRHAGARRAAAFAGEHQRRRRGRRIAVAGPGDDRRRPGPAQRRAADAGGTWRYRRAGVAIAKGPDRDAGNETVFLPGRAP